MTEKTAVLVALGLLAGLAAAAPGRAGEAAPAGTVRFVAVGDVLPDRGIRKSTAKNGFTYPFKAVAPLVSSADLAFANLEGCLDTTGKPLAKTWIFRGEPGFADGLSFAGFDVISLANNHALDGGRPALATTRQLLQDKGFVTVGAGASLDEACRPVRVERNGLSFTFLAYCMLPPDGFSLAKAGPVMAHASTDSVVAAVAAAKGSADFVVLSLHWGMEGNIYPEPEQVEFAHRAVDAGADLVIGTHPHVVQGVELYKGRPILYSLGNFVFDNPREVQRQALVFGCDFGKDGVGSPFLAPFYSRFLQPASPTPADLDGIVKRVNQASKRFRVEGRLEDGMIRLGPLGTRDPGPSVAYSGTVSESRVKR